MPIHVVGLGLDPDNLPDSHAEAIDSAQVLVGGKRLLEHFDDHPARKIPITAPLQDVFEQMARCDDKDDVVVLADGDPLFFGIGHSLVTEFGPESVRILPNVSTLQVAAARVKVPWQDVVTVSLHGRDDPYPLFAALMQHDWVAVLTDGRHIPAALAQDLMDKGADHFCMWVFEDLESDDERFGRYTLEEASHRSFSALNVILFERRGGAARPLHVGIPDEDLVTDRNLLTKWPVRAAGLAALHLGLHHVVWDLGAGCGAVAIEAAAMLRSGRVVAVEKNADRVGHIRQNVRAFGALLVDVVHGAMPRCLADLPDPDRIFLGGGMARSDEVLEAACERLAPGGRLVAHCVLLSTLHRVKGYLAAAKWPFDLTMVQASQGRELGPDVHLEAQNPVFIVAAHKPESGKRGR
jgi:precorrin-6Y C5,15-methyltransferase (decarboxylating)